MSFQGKEFTQGMKQLVINLKQFHDIESHQKAFKAVWAIEQTAKGLGIGQATVRRIMAEYNKNKQNVPDSLPKTRGSVRNTRSLRAYSHLYGSIYVPKT